MMKFCKTVFLVAFVCSGLAVADIVTVVDAVETIIPNVSVPTSTNARLTFRRCTESCDESFVSVRLTPETQFVVRGQRMKFVDFRAEFYSLRRNSDTYVLVSYDTEKNVVTSVHIGN